MKMILLKRWERRKPNDEFIIGARCTGIRAIEGGLKGPRIPIGETELRCRIICAVEVEASKTHATT
jgi:hypothetical protein